MFSINTVWIEIRNKFRKFVKFNNNSYYRYNICSKWLRCDKIVQTQKTTEISKKTSAHCEFA